MKVVTKIINGGVEVDSFYTSKVRFDGYRRWVPVDTSKLMLEIYDSETSTSSMVSYKKLDTREEILGVAHGEELECLFKGDKNFVRVYNDLEIVSSDYYTGEPLEFDDYDEFDEDCEESDEDYEEYSEWTEYDRYMEDLDSIEMTQYQLDVSEYEDCLCGMSPINAIYLAVKSNMERFVSESSDDFLVSLYFDNSEYNGAFRNCGCLSITAKIADRKSFNKDIVKYAIAA